MDDQLYITASCVLRPQTIFKDSVQVFKSSATGIASFLTEAYQQLAEKYPRFYKMDNLSKVGWLATEYLLSGGFSKEQYKPEEMGVVLSNANSSLDADTRYFDSLKEMASPALFVYTLPNIVIGEISIRHNFKGENAFFITEKFDAPLLQQYVMNLLNDDIVQACICGWIDVLNEDYKAVLFLVEKEGAIAGRENTQVFTIENLNNIYSFNNG